MTRAYDDIEAVTRLLEEKEKDLELTVQIGKELLTQNTRLEHRVADLESDVKTANESLAQLAYDLHTKSSLLAALTNDDDVSSEASKCLICSPSCMHDDDDGDACNVLLVCIYIKQTSNSEEAWRLLRYLRQTSALINQKLRRNHQTSTKFAPLITPLTPTLSPVPGTPNFPRSINLDLLQKKIGHLEDENKSLRAEASQLVRDTDAVEEQERKLMEDITAQLNSAHYQYDGINLELERYREENKLQHEQIVHLSAKLSDAEIRLHQLTSENEQQSSRLSTTEENQSLLASELTEFKARYHEVLALLQETQEQLRQQRRRAQPTVRGNLLGGGGGLGGSVAFGAVMGGSCGPVDSLQSELMESSLFSDNSLDSGIASERGHGHGHGHALMQSHKPTPGFNKVFETVRSASKAGHFAENATAGGSGSSSAAMSLISGGGGGVTSMTSGQPRMSAFPYAGSSASSNRYAASVYSSCTYASNESAASLGGKSMSRESLLSEVDDPVHGYPARPANGVPGAPGAKDLEAALRRLTPAQVLARRTMLSNAPPGTYNYDEPGAGAVAAASGGHVQAMGVRTPDSIMSTGSSEMSVMSAGSAEAGGGSRLGGLAHFGASGTGSYRCSTGSQRSSSTAGSSSGHHMAWRLPEKLQIIKPMEGSQTLHHWNRLATPTLGGLLDERPGVTTRGGRGLDELGLHVYSLSDVEEDECDEPPTAKQFATYGTVYTYTNSTVLHPDDGMSMTSSMPASQMSSRVESVSSSRQPR